MITAKILADSINPQGRRITSWLLSYPRFIHAEFMTHRDFSRNAASSRAIPLETTIRNIQENPSLPVVWGSKQAGMQSGPELKGGFLVAAKMASDELLQEAIEYAKIADQAGLHKSITNRWLEPWSYITVVATATDHRNFFALRAHPAAQPEFQVLAYRMLERYQASVPTEKKVGEWHMPFMKGNELFSIADQLKISVARCCWVSYNKPDKEATLADAIIRHDESAKYGHWSPFEHCACAVTGKALNLYSNFDTENVDSGWFQYRKQFDQERKTDIDLADILAERPNWTRTAGL